MAFIQNIMTCDLCSGQQKQKMLFSESNVFSVLFLLSMAGALKKNQQKTPQANQYNATTLGGY